VFHTVCIIGKSFPVVCNQLHGQGQAVWQSPFFLTNPHWHRYCHPRVLSPPEFSSVDSDKLRAERLTGGVSALAQKDKYIVTRIRMLLGCSLLAIGLVTPARAEKTVTYTGEAS
jgi:hypothetical protein